MFGLLLNCVLLKNCQYILPLLAHQEPETLIFSLNSCTTLQLFKLFQPIAKSVTFQ